MEDPTGSFLKDPTRRAYRLTKGDGWIDISFELPHVPEDEIEVHRDGDELVVHAGLWRRNIILPRRAAEMEIQPPTMSGGVLEIHLVSDGAKGRKQEDSVDARRAR